MPEIGLLPFARGAGCGGAVLPPYPARFPKHEFTQPQLLAVFCLMRYEIGRFVKPNASARAPQSRES